LQSLDKLLDNAVDYCPSGGAIEITLEHTAKSYRLVVSNQGPQLASEIADKLFDAMVGNRAGDAIKPHLGLGLFIVQLIARFHRGACVQFAGW
jgi:two-component system, OmpR family, sensor histidine kinase ChvG